MEAKLASQALDVVLAKVQHAPPQGSRPRHHAGASKQGVAVLEGSCSHDESGAAKGAKYEAKEQSSGPQRGCHVLVAVDGRQRLAVGGGRCSV